MNINIYDAKTNLSKLINLILEKKETNINICKNGVPVATIVPFDNTKKSKRVGMGKGIIKSVEVEDFNSIDVSDEFLNGLLLK